MTAEGLVELCRRLLGFYNSQGYRTTFPDIENIVPVKDPVVIGRLRQKLVEGIRAKSDSLFLAIPDMIDDMDQGYLASFSGAGSSLNNGGTGSIGASGRCTGPRCPQLTQSCSASSGQHDSIPQCRPLLSPEPRSANLVPREIPVLTDIADDFEKLDQTGRCQHFPFAD